MGAIAPLRPDLSGQIVWTWLFYKEHAYDLSAHAPSLAPGPTTLNPCLFGCGLFTFLDIITFIGFLIHLA